MTQYEKKRAALDILRVRYDELRTRLYEIDPRLTIYFDSLTIVRDVETDADPQDCQPAHNYYEPSSF